MTSTPKISVVMPAYNAAPYLDEAVRSILEQTFRDFEFVVIDDGSTDATAAILERYAKMDGRMRIHHQNNQGVIAALNRGCRLARGEYIARMDADDVSLPWRLQKQLDYIERRPQTGIVGTWIYNVDQNGTVKNAWRPPTEPHVLDWTHFFGVCVSHPSVLLRTEVLRRLDFYRDGTAHIEDVDLWLRASRITRFGNVPEILLKYRAWGGNVSQTRRCVARDAHVQRLTAFIAEFLGSEVSPEAVAGLRQTRVGPPPESLTRIRETAELIRRLHRTFEKKRRPTIEEMREISWDAAKRLAVLGLQASRFDARASLSLFLQALQTDPRLLSPSALVKGVHRALRLRSGLETGPEVKIGVGLLVSFFFAQGT